MVMSRVNDEQKKISGEVVKMGDSYTYILKQKNSIFYPK